MLRRSFVSSLVAFFTPMPAQPSTICAVCQSEKGFESLEKHVGGRQLPTDFTTGAGVVRYQAVISRKYRDEFCLNCGFVRVVLDADYLQRKP